MPGGEFFSGTFYLVGIGGAMWIQKVWPTSKGVVVAVLGLAEFVEEEDHGLQAQDQHYSADEARGIEGVLVRVGGGGDWCGAGVGWS